MDIKSNEQMTASQLIHFLRYHFDNPGVSGKYVKLYIGESTKDRKPLTLNHIAETMVIYPSLNFTTNDEDIEITFITNPVSGDAIVHC